MRHTYSRKTAQKVEEWGRERRSEEKRPPEPGIYKLKTGGDKNRAKKTGSLIPTLG